MASMHLIYALITRAWPYWALAIVLIVAKFQLIAFYANGTPYLDQWDAEADLLYSPWLEGHFDWQQLFAPHNEHRILTARVLSLLLFELGGETWNPLLQMKVNAVLHVAAICVLLYFLSRVIRGGYRTALFLFAGALFAIPFGWENTLAGFQSQFYLLLLFSFVFLWAMSGWPCFSERWWMGLLAGVLSVFTMASGALTMLAGGLILLIRRYWFGESRAVALSAIVLILGVALLAIHYTPTIPHHVGLRADSLFVLLKALVRIVAWPASEHGEGLLFIQVPLLLLIVQILWRRTIWGPRPAGLVFILAMALWLYGQFASIAYGRATGALSSRYLDLFAIGLILNFAALLYLRASVPRDSRRQRRHANSAILLWLAVVAFGFIKSGPKLAEDLIFKARTGNEQERNVRNYLCSGDYFYLLNKPLQFIPYPDPARLKSLLEDPNIRRILPGNINEALAESKVGPDGEPFCNTGETVRAFDVMKYGGSNHSREWAGLDAVEQSGWNGQDYHKSDLLGFKVLGSFEGSEKNSGILVLRLKRGQSMLYRSGPRVGGQSIIVNSKGQVKNFNTELPVSLDWSVLDFSNPLLPDEFTVSFIDSGTRWGEWSAVGLME